MWNPDDVLDAMAQVHPREPWPDGAPVRDFTRSPAAARVARLAAEQGLFLFHFEHRYPLDLPASWVIPGREDAATLPDWTDGVLPEPKYQSFRHDLMIGSFHPGHRGKWSTHELCHGLVGFAWRPGAPRLFHATAGRLAELVPVVLYYFLDEIGLARCPLHAGGGALYQTWCSACEACAAYRPLTPDDRQFAADAARFLDAELAAIARTRRLKTPIHHRFGSLDLCSDGLSYAEAHHLRLHAEAMERLITFFVEGQGWSATLDALEERVVAVARAIALGEPLPPLAPDAASGRDRWIRQDLAFRLLTLREERDGEAATVLDGFVERLREDPIGDVLAAWPAAAEAYALPDAERVFGVGYPIGPYGRAREQIDAGIASVCPLTYTLAEDAGLSLADFPDPPLREPLGDRLVRWLRGAHPEIAPLAAFETALRTVREDLLRERLGDEGEGAVLCAGTRVLHADYDVLHVAEAVERGDIEGRVEGGQLRLHPPPPREPWAMVVGRHAGDLVLLEIDPDDAEALRAGSAVEIAPELREHGVMRPARYPL